MTVTRYDFGRIKRVTKTPQGGRLIPATPTRAGVFSYRRADGSTVRELRHPDDVFKKESLDSLAGCPVTYLHPPEMVNASNWKQYALGHMKDTVRHDNRSVHVDLVVQEESGVKKVDNKEVSELSCGYNCEMVKEAGVYLGERYDERQTDIVYNHVGMGPKGWGRQGSEAAMHLDSANADEGAAICEHYDDDSHSPNKEKTTMSEVRIDGIPYDSGSAGHVQALEKKANDAQARFDSATKEVTDLKATAEETSGKLEAETTRADKAEGELKVATDPKHLDAMVATRTALIDRARKLDEKGDFEGLTEREIMVKALKANDEDFDDTDRKDGYIEGMFGMCVKNSEKAPAKKSTGSLNKASASASKNDAKEDKQEKSRKDSQSAWQRPLAFTKPTAAN